MTYRKEIMIAALAGLIALGGAAASAKSPEHGKWFEKIDANADGEITPEEMREMGKSRFAKMDSDGDGFLSGAETMQHHGERGEKRAAKMLERFDANGNGALEADELEKAFESLQGKRAKHRMARMDANEDGKLSMEEMMNGRGEKMFARLDKDGSGTLNAEEFKEMRKGMKNTAKSTILIEVKLEDGGGCACFARPAQIATDMMHDPKITSDADAHAALLARYAEGDPAAARMLAAELTPRMYAHSLRVLGDRAEAEDVVQEAMIRLWRIAPEWRQGEAKVTTWLYRVVANLCTDRLRKRRTVSLDDAGELRDQGLSAAQVMQHQARHDALQAALASLPDRQRQAVVLRHIDGLANPEIAVILDVGVEAVESLTARGKRALTRALADQRDALGFQGDE